MTGRAAAPATRTTELGMSYSAPTMSVLSRLGQPRDYRSIGDVAAPWLKWVDDVPAGTWIAVDATAPWVGAPPDIWFFYPLFGSRFENEVFPLPTEMSARRRKELGAQNIRYVVVGARGRFVEWAQAEARAVFSPTSMHSSTGECSGVKIQKSRDYVGRSVTRA